MMKNVIIFLVSLVLVIAYIDLVDSFKHIDNVISDMIKTRQEIRVQK